MSWIEPLESRALFAITFSSVLLPPQMGVYALGDVSGDGHVDLLTSAGGIGRMAIYAGLGNLAFASTPFTDLVASGASRPEAADFDGDGKLDVVFAGTSAARVFRNLGGTFSDAPTINLGPDVRDIRFLDFNGDGNLDILTANNALWPTSYGTPQTYGAGLLLGNGDATFQPVRKITLPHPQLTIELPPVSRVMVATEARKIAFGYGNDDLNPMVQVLDHTNWNAPTVSTFEPVEGLGPIGGLGFGDIDTDGRLDVVVFEPSGHPKFGGSKIHRFLAEPDGLFTAQPILTLDLAGAAAVSLEQLSMADFDRNGTMDFVVNGIAPHPQSGLPRQIIFEGRGDGTFTQIFSSAFLPTRQREQDVNGDGRIDLLYSGGSRARVLINTSTPPPAVASELRIVEPTRVIELMDDLI